MLYRYEVKNNGKEDILYLYLNMKHEFSKELIRESSDKEITRRAKNFIINNDIKFNGNKVFLIIDGIVVKTLDMNIVAPTAKNNPAFSNNEYLVNVKLEDNSIIEINLKNYLLGVLAAIYNDTIQDETLKCIAIIYRTYAYKMKAENEVIDNTMSFLKYRDITSYKLGWVNNYQNIIDRFSAAIDETDCLFLSYQDKFILPFIHINNTGKTYENKEYPYLSSVSSLWDLASENYKEIVDYDYKNLSNLLGIEVNNKSKIEIFKVDKNNSVLNLKIDNKIFSGEELKQLLSLKSLNFNIILYHNFFRVINFGFGNFLGLSVFGANELSLDGIDYPNILKYYFPKVKLNKYIKELP